MFQKASFFYILLIPSTFSSKDSLVYFTTENPLRFHIQSSFLSCILLLCKHASTPKSMDFFTSSQLPFKEPGASSSPEEEESCHRSLSSQIRTPSLGASRSLEYTVSVHFTSNLADSFRAFEIKMSCSCFYRVLSILRGQMTPVRLSELRT